jgi:hypothetical protein
MVLGASRPGGGFDDRHHRFRGAFRGGGLGCFPSYDDYGYADFDNYGGAAPDRSTASK